MSDIARAHEQALEELTLLLQRAEKVERALLVELRNARDSGACSTCPYLNKN